MKKLYFTALIFILILNIGYSQNTKSSFKSQLWKNSHFGWDVDNGDGYKWNNFYIGTGIARNFDFNNKAYWYVMGDLNWSKYKLYKLDKYNKLNVDIFVRTFSFSVPAYLGYNIYESKLKDFGVKLYTGPVIETIISANQDGISLPSNGLNYNPVQFGWTIGTGVKFLYLFGFNVAYRYYPTPVLNNGNLVRSSVNFTFGF